MDDCRSAKGCELGRLAEDADRRRVLTAVLAINAVMFVAEFSAGALATGAGRTGKGFQPRISPVVILRSAAG